MPGYEQLHTNKLKDIVFEVCRNGSRCEFACWRKKSNHAIFDGSPCAATARTTQEDNDIMKTVHSIRLLNAISESLTHAEEEVKHSVYVYGMKEEFNTNIQNLIVKWDLSKIPSKC